MSNVVIPDGREIYISVDIEADGPIPGDYSMVSLGAKVIGYGEEEFYAELAPVSDNWVPEALAVSGFSREKTLTFPDAATETTRFEGWLDGLYAQHTTLYGGKWVLFPKLVMVGFNAPFDWSFVNWYLHHFAGRNPLGISALDIKAIYLGLTGCNWGETSMRRLPAELRPSDGLSHNALEDARDQGRMFEQLMARLQAN